MGLEERRSFKFNNAGFETQVDIACSQIERVHRPIVKELLERAQVFGGECFVVILAGPPGVGKSTLAAVWGVLSQEKDQSVSFQALSADGFFYPNDQLKELNVVKGTPESLDLVGLTEKMASVRNGLPFTSTRWPFYDRRIHDSRPDDIEVIKSGIVVVEGIYLLLDEPGWMELRNYADFSIFVTSRVKDVREGVIARYQKSHNNLSRKDAELLYESSDRPHHEMIIKKRLPAGMELSMGKDYTFSLSVPAAVR